MNFKNALKITFHEYKTYLKSLIYRLILFICFFSLGYVLLKDFLTSMASQGTLTTFFKSVKESFVGFVKGRGWSNKNNLATSFKDLVTLFFKNLNKHYAKTTLFFASLILYIMLNTLADVALTDCNYNFMSNGSKRGFFGAIIKNLRNGSVYAILYAIYSLAIIVILFFLSIVLIMALMNVIGFFTMPLIVFIVIFAFALKQRIISTLLPKMIAEEKSVFTCIKENKIVGFWDELIKYTFAYFTCFTLCMIFFVFTFGAGTILALPLLSIMVNVMGLTSYFENNNQRYYVSENEIYKY